MMFIGYLNSAGLQEVETILHPYFWMFCFTTGLTDQWHGPSWFMRDYKDKHYGMSIRSLDIFGYVTVGKLYVTAIGHSMNGFSEKVSGRMTLSVLSTVIPPKGIYTSMGHHTTA